ncbi:NAD-dependent epimerase/dehydratase family protein [Candidatus Planktophila dulcis]|uniref:NAD-dependent epimerase/dehydratase family protein n=1 Tax=Candidatus Planktophila dulcis TaxID=1884914 RepID=UPI003CED3F7B
MNALVTGGAGFIGCHLAAELIAQGHEVTIVDDLSSGFASNIPNGADFIQADLTNTDTYELLTEGFTHVFHLASHVGQELSFETPVRDLEVNLLVTSRIIKWALDNGKPRIIFASSMNVYGDPANSTDPVSEETPVSLPSPYAVGKYSSELLLDVYRPFGISSASLRFFNVYGAKQDLSNLKQGMVSIFMSYVLKGKPVEVRGSLDRFRDFIHVSDVVDACILVAKSECEGVINVSTGVKTTVKSLIESIISAFREDPRIYPIIELAPTPRDQFGVFGVSNRLKELGWAPKITLEKGLAEMAKWAKGLKD